MIIGGAIVAFVAQLVAVRVGRPEALAFVVWEVVTAILTPLIALGLLFGACLMGGFKM